MSQVIPEGWLEQPIGNIANVVAGGTPKAGNPDNFATPGSEIAWLTPADLSKYKSKFILHGARDLSQEGYDSSSAKLMPKGALLFSSRAPIGYVVIAENPICTNQGFKNFVFTEQVDSTYAFYYLKSIRDLAESLGSGTTFKELSGATAKTIPFRLAPLAEQKVIADKLDELLTQVDSTKARLDAIPAILKSFRQSVLAAAVSGKLTEEWRGDSDYQTINKYFSVPRSWEQSKIELVIDYVTSGSRGWAKYYSDSGSLFIRSQDINSDELKIEDAAFVSLPDQIEGRRTKVQKEDLLITITGANVTKCARIRKSIEDAYISQHVALLRLKDTSNSVFIELMLKAQNAGRKQLTDMAYGGGKPGLNLQNIKDVEFALPTLKEQTEIVRRVEELFAFADKVEAQVNAAQARVNNLTQSILAKAFRGELTADWRTENPSLISGSNSAEALLDHIKAEREALAVKKKPAKKPRAKKATV
ncbi:restriction endonuclease subunit S [Shewanella sp. D64]|uniref:restriction endonuclease subunit S n=1 Tax=unclassified Shewanella TaxID=196818 RepID=UPI0022BA3626|nr:MULTISPECIES: restriction endonuclease subunit S [unclassified Shewanella]MEC4726797.1 restriction endonuclease subunit S [Shewanella sp. D64]MEC4739091.1 restriction endonuclease subunit S [Shewanella sp. E94]WBJ95947.1 restriction endonuclease subunit S [Shewanella sp. MTB7]